MIRSISKQLSRNDLGLTGGHQAGICVPRAVVAVHFFPCLNPDEYNPRTDIDVETENGPLILHYIYYNNKLFGSGTRNEYRLTGLSSFFRTNNCEVGDVLKFSYDEEKEVYSLRVSKNERYMTQEEFDRPIVIRSGWAFEGR